MGYLVGAARLRAGRPGNDGDRPEFGSRSLDFAASAAVHRGRADNSLSDPARYGAEGSDPHGLFRQKWLGTARRMSPWRAGVEANRNGRPKPFEFTEKL
jgi:hypothetical protein